MTVISAGQSRFSNNFQTTVAAPGITTIGQTTIPITSALGSPNPGPFRILIESELMQVTGGYGTTTLTVIRGVEGTAPATHIATSNIIHDVTAFDFNSFRQEFNVISYGAKGDGSTDDSTAFQNAINDAHALTGGGSIFLPTLNYKVVSVLTTYSNVVFVTYGATFTGAGATSVVPLIKWGLTGTLTVPATLTASNGLVVAAGGLTVSASGMNVTGTSVVTGNLTLTAAQASGAIGLTISPAAVGTVIAETVAVQQSAQTLTITSGYSNQRFTLFNAPTITAGSVLTVATAATVAISGAPVAGGSAVLTNSYALWIQGGGLNLAASTNNTVPTLPSASGAKIWVQSGDPGGSAANGDLWVAG